MTQEQARLLRFIVDFDGNIDLGVARRLLSGGLDPALFMEYDSKTQDFKKTTASMIVTFAMGYYDVYGVPPTDDALSSEVYARGDLDKFALDALYKDLASIRVLIPNPNEVNYYLDRVQEQYLTAKALEIMGRGMESIKEDPRRGVDFIVKGLTQATSKVSAITQNQDTKAMMLNEFAAYLLDEFVEHGELMHGALPYPYQEFNKVLGGMYPGDLIVIAAPSNLGKSFIAHDIGFHVAMDLGHPVAFADREMQHKQNGTRFVSRMTGVPSRIIRKKSLQTPEETALIREALEEYAAAQERANNILFIPPALCANTAQIRRHIEMSGIVPSLIVQDYMTIMEPVRRSSGGGGWEDIQQIAADLKMLAQHFSVPVLALAQTNDKGAVQYKGIRHVCDTLLILSEDKDNPYKYPEPGEFVGTPGIINVWVDKSRNDAKDINMRLEVEFATASIRQAPKPLKTKIAKAAQAQRPYRDDDVDEVA